MAMIFLSGEDRAGRPGAPKLWSVGRHSVRVFSTIQGARTQPHHPQPSPCPGREPVLSTPKEWPRLRPTGLKPEGSEAG